LNAGHLFPLRFEVKQILRLFDGVGQLGRLPIASLIGKHVEIVLKDVDGFIGLQSTLHLRIHIIQKVSKVIVLDLQCGWLLLDLANLQAFVYFSLEVSLRACFGIWMGSLQSNTKKYCTRFP